MTHNRIERLERDLASRRRRHRSNRASGASRTTQPPSSVSLSVDDGGAINLVCDRPQRPIEASYVDAFEVVGAVDGGPDIDDPTTAGSADPTATYAVADPTAAGPTTGATVDPTVARAPAAEPETVQSAQPASPAQPITQAPAANDPQPIAAPADALDGWQVTSDAPDQETAFAQDIAAILAHTSGEDTPSAPMSAATPARQPQASASPAVSPPGVGAPSGHDVFDRMAAANRYDQGPIALSIDFDAMDRAISRGQSAAPFPPPPVAHNPGSAPSTAPPASAPTPPSQTPAAAEPSRPPAAPPPPEASIAGIADLAAIDAITAASGPFRVSTDVPLLPQVPGLSCHAAACASIAAWRDDVKPVPADVAAATGYWERYAEGRTAVYPDVLDAFGLTHSVVGQTPSATALKDLIERGGPLWTAAAPPGEHAVVISGVTGDGTSSGTMVDVVDPWARGMTTFGSPNPGSSYHLSLAELLANIAGAAGSPVVIAQLKEGRSR